MAAVAALLCAVPTAARPKPAGSYALIVQGPGDESDPSIDDQFVAFSSDAGGDRDVLVCELGGTPDALTTTVTAVVSGAGDQDQPSIHRTTLAYRAPSGIFVVNWTNGATWRTPTSPGTTGPGRRCQPLDPVSQPAVSDVLAAWVCGSAGARTVVVARYRDTPLEEYDLAASGDVLGAAVSGARVGFVDGSDGSVWLHDSASRQTTRVCAGTATSVSVGDVGMPVVAVSRRSTSADADIEIWDPAGGLGTAGLLNALRVPGEQLNPRVSGEWVAFEDVTGGRSQVVLWRWTTGLVVQPHPTAASNQTLDDLTVATTSAASYTVRVVYADDGDGSRTRRDIALYSLTVTRGVVPDDGQPNPLPWDPASPCTPDPRPPPASCDDVFAGEPDPCPCRDGDGDGDGDRHGRGALDRDVCESAASAAPFTTQRLVEEDGDHDEGEPHHHGDRCGCERVCAPDAPPTAPRVLVRLELDRHTGKPRAEGRTFEATPYPGDAYLPVLVCVDLDHASSGWLVLDDELLAGPSAFRNGVTHLELRSAVHRATGRLTGLVAGKPGATLVARVIADPGSYPAAAPACSRSPLATVPPGEPPAEGGAASSSAGTGQAAEASGAGGGPGGKPGGAGCGTPGGGGALGGVVLVALLRLRRRTAAARG